MFCICKTELLDLCSIVNYLIPESREAAKFFRVNSVCVFPTLFWVSNFACVSLIARFGDILVNRDVRWPSADIPTLAFLWTKLVYVKLLPFVNPNALLSPPTTSERFLILLFSVWLVLSARLTLLTTLIFFPIVGKSTGMRSCSLISLSMLYFKFFEI